MTYTTPFTAVTGAVITSSGWNASARDNLLHLRALLPDPSGSGLTLVSTSATAAAFSTAATVPAGLIAAFETAAAIASGWARYSAADGRMLVGAGTTFAVTYVEATNYGASWSHSHTQTNHSHDMASHGHAMANHTHSFSGTSGGPSALDGLGNNGGTNTPSTTHTHGTSGTTGGNNDTTGANSPASTGTASANDISTDAWVIPARGIVWAQKS